MQSALALRNAQQITLSPQIVQAIRLLQLSAADLESELDDALARNPCLERAEGAPRAIDGAEAPAPGDPDRVDAAPAGDDEAALGTGWSEPAPRVAVGERDFEDFGAAQPSLRDHLLEQLAGSRFEPADRQRVQTVIDALDDDGYLRQSSDELLRALPPEVGAQVDDMEIAIRYVQSLDPPGVAARSLAECLAIQLERLPEGTSADGSMRMLALRIVRESLDLLALHDARRLAQRLRCDEQTIRGANNLIRRLNPRPGAAFGELKAHYVVADVIVHRRQGRWVAAINPQAVPNLRINRALAEQIRAAREGPGPLGQYLQEARWLIRNVHQRFETIRRVAQAIVDRQRRYFELGELALRPLALRDVARELGLHASTVSRVSCNKYALTPAGVIELKRFFSNRATYRQGSASVSSTAIRALIRRIVDAEDVGNPLSDVQITHLLARRGIDVARRTVAKYRAAIGIAPVESRRMAVDGAAGRASSARPIAALALEHRTRRKVSSAAPPDSDQDRDSSPSDRSYSFRRL